MASDRLIFLTKALDNNEAYILCYVFIIYFYEVLFIFEILEKVWSVLHVKTFFFNLHSGGWNQGPLDTAAT
jgi:hypothetical protein